MEIVVRQMSGLGNQLFQYAAGLYYATKYKATLRVSIDPAENPSSMGSPRPFQLNVFSIAAPMRKANALEQLLCSQNPRIRGVAAAARRMAGAGFWQEPSPHRFFPELPFRAMPATVFLRSYWQAAGYAAAVEDRLREDLRFKDRAAGKDAETLDAIASSRCPISVHLRRGDYALSTASLVLPLDYYRLAWKMALEEFEGVEFFVFSDDIEYAQKHLPLDGVRHFIAHNDTATAFQDLRLMAACRHHIIANSSFSWWGAWMDPKPGQLIITPKYWRNTADSYYPDLFPASWRLVDNRDRPRVSGTS